MSSHSLTAKLGKALFRMCFLREGKSPQGRDTPVGSPIQGWGNTSSLHAAPPATVPKVLPAGSVWHLSSMLAGCQRRAPDGKYPHCLAGKQFRAVKRWALGQEWGSTKCCHQILFPPPPRVMVMSLISVLAGVDPSRPTGHRSSTWGQGTLDPFPKGDPLLLLAPQNTVAAVLALYSAAPAQGRIGPLSLSFLEWLLMIDSLFDYVQVNELTARGLGTKLYIYF